MSEWKEIRLDKFIKTNTKNINKDYQFSKILYLDTGSITRNKIEKLQEFEISKAPSRAKRLVSENDIIYSSVRPNQLHFGYIKNPQKNLVVSTGFVVITCNNNYLYPLFLYYYLTQDSLTQYLHSIAEASTSAYPSLKPRDIESLVVFLPPLPEQKAIASVLSSLDDKIDLLHRQNKTLEAMAETLFRQWFIEEADDSWEVKPLDEIAVVQNGYGFRSSDFVTYDDGHLEVLKMGHIERGGGLKLNPKKDFVPREEKFNKWILNKNDIVMAMTDMKDNVVILGVPAIIDKSDKYVLNQRVARIYLRNNKDLISSYLLYIQLKDHEFIANLQSKANSGVQVNLSTQTIKDSEIIIPPLELQNKLGKTIQNLYSKKEINDIQILTLENLRDTLLPKLMSGEVRVKME